MHDPVESIVLARLSILAPPSGQPDEDGRVRLSLQRSREGRYRWFHKDGSPTVVAEMSVARALTAARFAWRSWDLQFDQEGCAQQVESSGC